MNYSQFLRSQLSSKSLIWAKENNVPYYTSIGSEPVTLFEPYENGSKHGNFHSYSWVQIISHPDWKKRLDKAHPPKKSLPDNKQESAKELDSCNSSDALLMNIFCYPNIIDSIQKIFPFNLLKDSPFFGLKPEIPFKNGGKDNSEIDMVINGIFFEAKLTEPDFTKCDKVKFFSYAFVKDVFDIDALPQEEGFFTSYQLIRNILAAYKYDNQFILLYDGRRPDLEKSFDNTVSSILINKLKHYCPVVFRK